VNGTLTLFCIGRDDLFWLLRYGDVMKISNGQLMLDLKNRIQLYLFKIIEGLTTKFKTETNVYSFFLQARDQSEQVRRKRLTCVR
jgi:hypothetical protein